MGKGSEAGKEEQEVADADHGCYALCPSFETQGPQTLRQDSPLSKERQSLVGTADWI